MIDPRRQARVAIRTHLPSTLVTAGVFTFKAVQKPGPNGLILPYASFNIIAGQSFSHFAALHHHPTRGVLCTLFSARLNRLFIFMLVNAE